MRHNDLPSLDQLDALFEVDFDRGSIRWRKPRVTKLAQVQAGTVNSRGYRKIKIAGTEYPAHRVIYAMRHRLDPGDMEIDHLNGVFDDNRIANLRLATRDVNCANRKSWRKGLRGAYAKDGRWMAVIQIEKDRRYLGTFDTEDQAHAAFSRAASEHYGNTVRLD